MIYRTLYQRVAALLGNRKDADEKIRVWVQDAITTVIALHPERLPLRTVDIAEFEQDDLDLYYFPLPEGWVTVNTLSYQLPTGLLKPIKKGNTDHFVHVPTVLWSEPEFHILLDGNVYLWPKLTNEPTLVRVTGVIDYAPPEDDEELTADEQTVPLPQYLIPPATALAVAFAKIYLGEAEQAGTIRRLSELLMELQTTPGGQYDMHGIMGVGVYNGN